LSLPSPPKDLSYLIRKQSSFGAKSPIPSSEEQHHEAPAHKNVTVPNASENAIAAFRRKYGYPRPDGLKFGGLSHIAMVCSDMEKTVQFFGDTMGLTLVKTIALPGGGQHFFFDIGKDEQLAYFWFPKAPKAMPGVSSVNPQTAKRGGFQTAHGSMNHFAFKVTEGQLHEYREKLLQRGVKVSRVYYHSDIPSGYTSTKDDNTSFMSCYFFGPDGEYLEFSALARPFTPEADVSHVPERPSQS